MFNSLESKGTRFLRGQLCLICAGPGVGKSAFTLTYALKAMVPTLYLSADSDAFTQLSRMVSIQTGWPLEKSSQLVRDGDLNGATPALENVPIRFSYNASPSLDQIESSMLSYEEVYGDYPTLVIVDNITNVRLDSPMGDDDPFSGLEGLMDYLHDMARNTGSLVIGLHHVTGPYNDANKPIPLSGIKGQIARVPEMVLTMFKPVDGSLGVSTVKNRSGKANPSGEDYVTLSFDGARMQIKDYT